ARDLYSIIYKIIQHFFPSIVSIASAMAGANNEKKRMPDEA
ncbi:unnamed protein product, partial [marine sediment metagenome]